MRRAARGLGLAAVFFASALASSAPAQAPVEWLELRRGAVRTWEYRIHTRKPGGRVEALTRVHCRPDLTDTQGCLEAVGVARLSDLKLLSPSITVNKALPEGRAVFWEIEGHILDCAARTHRRVFREYYDGGDELVTRADFKDEGWKAWEGNLEELGARACE